MALDVQQGPTLPGVEADEEDRIVLHVDLDCFYAACERLREPALEDEPVVVGMGYEPGDSVGAVATASYEAREHGVESAQAITTALERLPRDAGDGADDADEERADGPVGHYRPVDMEYYESVAADVKAVLHDVADTVREVSIDEAYLDVTEHTDWSVAEGYARHVKQRIEREVGLVASVGAAPTMHAAKVASDHDKPDGLVVVEPGEVREFLAALPVEDLHGIGPVTARELRERAVETVADLADADREWIRDSWGDRGLELQDRARGHDPRVVEPRGRPKSLSRESAFAEPEADHETVRERIRALGDAVADRAQSKEAMYRTIGVKVVLPPYDVNTRERSLSGPVDDPDLVASVALDLLAEFEAESPRKVGVRVSNLIFEAADQSTLGGWERRGAGSGDAAADAGDASASTPGSDDVAATSEPSSAPRADADPERVTQRASDSRGESSAGSHEEPSAGLEDGSASARRPTSSDRASDSSSRPAPGASAPEGRPDASLDTWQAAEDGGSDDADSGSDAGPDSRDATAGPALPAPATDALPPEQTTLSEFV